MTLEAIGLFENDTQQLTPGQKVELRRRLPGVTTDRAIQAMSQYRHFMICAGKRPFLHDKQSRIVAPVTPEVIDQLQKLTGISVLNCEPWWPRQMNRLDRSEEGGRKIYDDTILDRMAAKRAKRQTRQLLRKVEPPRVEIEDIEPSSFQIEDEDVEPIDDTQQVVKSLWADTPVVFKKFGQKTTVLVITNGDRKHAEVYSVENGTGRSMYSSVAQKYTDAELDEKGWKHGKLGDVGFEPILNALELVSHFPEN